MRNKEYVRRWRVLSGSFERPGGWQQSPLELWRGQEAVKRARWVRNMLIGNSYVAGIYHLKIRSYYGTCCMQAQFSQNSSPDDLNLSKACPRSGGIFNVFGRMDYNSQGMRQEEMCWVQFHYSNKSLELRRTVSLSSITSQCKLLTSTEPKIGTPFELAGPYLINQVFFKHRATSFPVGYAI